MSTTPTRAELLARLEAAKQRAEALKQRVDKIDREQNRGDGRAPLRILGLVAASSLGAVLFYWWLGGWGWAVLGFVVGAAVTLAILLRLNPAPAYMTPGTRAFEAYHTTNVLVNVIAARRAERGALDDAAQARMDREIAFLENQLADLRAIVAANDGSPGKGYIGFDPYNGN